MAKTVPGKGAQIAGQDYCSVEEPEGAYCDLDLPGGLKVEDAKGGSGDSARS